MKKLIIVLSILFTTTAYCIAGVECKLQSKLGECIDENYSSKEFDRFINVEGLRVMEYGHVKEYPIDVSDEKQVEFHDRILYLLNKIYYKRNDKKYIFNHLGSLFSTCYNEGGDSRIGSVCKELSFDVIGQMVKMSNISFDEIFQALSGGKLSMRGNVDLSEHYTPIADYYSFVQKEYSIGKYLLGIANAVNYFDSNDTWSSLYVLKEGDTHRQRLAVLYGKIVQNKSSLKVLDGKLIWFFPIKEEIINKNMYYTIIYYELQSDGSWILNNCQRLDVLSDVTTSLELDICRDLGEKIKITTVLGKE